MCNSSKSEKHGGGFPLLLGHFASYLQYKGKRSLLILLRLRPECGITIIVYKAQRATCDDAGQSPASDAICPRTDQRIS